MSWHSPRTTYSACGAASQKEYIILLQLLCDALIVFLDQLRLLPRPLDNKKIILKLLVAMWLDFPECLPGQSLPQLFWGLILLKFDDFVGLLLLVQLVLHIKILVVLKRVELALVPLLTFRDLLLFLRALHVASTHC